MGLFPEYTEEELEKLQVSVPNVEFATIESATKTLENLDLEVKVKGDGGSVVKQIPTGVSVERGSSVVLYTDESYKTNNVSVPNLQGLTREQAKAVLESVGLNLSVEGSGADEDGAIASSDQNYAEGASVPEGTAVTVTFVESSVGSQ